ncbi:MAG: hypothetical protein FJ301_06970 [Planctomycetes bacterium]|nr:hypothetical protein [Planctomycetota bacterium]
MSQGPQGGGPVVLEWPGDLRDLPAAGGVWYWLAALSVAAAALAWWAWRRRSPSAAAPIVASTATLRTPDAAAWLRALALPADAAATVVFAAKVKRIVRLRAWYQWALAAELMTSEELQRYLPAAPGLAPCLGACDRVLFANGSLDADAAAAVRAQAIAFVEYAPEPGTS